MKINKRKSSLLFICIALLAFIFACENPLDPERPNYVLTWSDEFEGPAGQSPDAGKWTYDIGRGDNGWGNAELQSYTNNPENVSLDGEGNLAITAIEATPGSYVFSSARIKTQGLFDQTYGRFEARIKLPYGPGIWPAFWMLGSDIDSNPWPQCGEIDIMEFRGQETNLIHGTLHGPGYSGGASITKSYALQQGRFDTDFYLYAVEWEEDYIRFFVNDVLYNEIRKSDVTGDWVFNKPFFLLLNLAVGGNYLPNPAGNTPFPQTMLIDYVRVYQAQ
jgi:beta-glucanase (GH16 family)